MKGLANTEWALETEEGAMMPFRGGGDAGHVRVLHIWPIQGVCMQGWEGLAIGLAQLLF